MNAKMREERPIQYIIIIYIERDINIYTYEFEFHLQ